MRSALLIVSIGLMLTSCASNGIYHQVQPGQTLYRIAKTYEVDEAYLAKVNRINNPTELEAGRRLYIPGATRTRQVIVDPPKAPPAPVVPPPSVKATRSKPAPVASKAKPAAKKPVPVGKSEEIPGPRPAPGTFVWPVRGQLVTEFGAAEGKSSKGIEIVVPHGTPVSAAAAGKVIYSGNGIRGYGNLIILEHADNYFTVYGFNAKNLVTVNNFVGQGDRIALSGSPSGSKSPRLHFEIRKGKTAANPIFFLP
jgi:lipoprotein NlpD